MAVEESESEITVDTSQSTTQDQFSDEEEEDDEIQDWSTLSAIKKGGPKDLEPLLSLNDTNVLSSYDQIKLNKARNMRFNVLDAKRGLTVNLSNINQSTIYINLDDLNDLFMVNPRGKFLETMGDIDRYNVCHLNYEEVVYLVERGSCLAKLYHPNESRNEIYKRMPPLSLQLVYSILIKDDEMMDKYMVYSILKRDGYIVSRHEEFSNVLSNIKRDVIKPANVIGRNFKSSWWFNIFSYFDLPWILSFSYQNIFQYLHLKVMDQSLNPKLLPIEKELTIAYNVWKPTGTFKKKNKPLPDYQISIMKASEKIPNFTQIISLLERSQTIETKRKEWSYIKGININSLKKSDINITIAIVDNSIMNFLNFNDCSFTSEGPVWRDAWAHPKQTVRGKKVKRQKNGVKDETSQLLKIDTISKIKSSMPNKSISTPNLFSLQRPNTSKY